MKISLELLICYITLFTMPTFVHTGCYFPVALNSVRQDAGLGVDQINSKLYIAGGYDVSSQSLSSRVDVLDQISNSWTSFQLPAPRRRIHVFVHGHNVYFAGGVPQYDFIDIYNTLEERFVSVPLPDLSKARKNELKSVIIGSAAYIFGEISAFCRFDLTSNQVTYVSEHLNIMAATTNGTAIYFLMRGGWFLIWDTLTMNSTQVNTGVNYMEQLSSIFIIGNTVLLHTSSLLIQITFPLDRRTVEVPGSSSIVQVGSVLFLVSDGLITTYTPERGIIHYSIDNEFFSSGWNAVELNGQIYFSGINPTRSIITINTNALLQEIDMPFSPTAALVLNGFYFTFSRTTTGNNVKYIKLSTRQQFTYDISSVNFVTVKRESTEKKELFVFDRINGMYDIFDTENERWISGEISFPISISVAPVVLPNNVIVLNNNIDRSSYFLNLTSREWWSTKAGADLIVPVGKSLLYIYENDVVRFYDTNTRQWTHNITVPELARQRRARTTSIVHGDLYFIAGGLLDSEYVDDVFIFNAADGSVTLEHLSLPRMNPQVAATGDYVIFAGGVGLSGAAGLRVDVFNIRMRQWRDFNLFQNALGALTVVTHENLVYFGRTRRIELLNLTSGVMQLAPIPFGSPYPGFAGTDLPGISYGSKVLFFGRGVTFPVVTIYETSTSQSSSFEFRNNGPMARQDIYFTNNFVVLALGGYTRVLEFPTMTNKLSNNRLFIGQTNLLDTGARGVNIRAQWSHNNLPMIGETETILNLNATQQAQGEYSVKIVDQCNQQMTQRASLIVDGPPVIIDELTESLVMCHEMTTISTKVSGEQVTLNWTIGSMSETTTEKQPLLVNGSSFMCNTVHDLCVTAINPSGTTAQCTTVRFAAHDSVFSGPRPISSQPLFLRKTNASLVVSLLDYDCDEHVWLVNGVESDVVGRRTSTMTVHLDQDTIVSRFSVRAQCGNSNLTSHEFKFNNVSSLDVARVVVVVLVCFFAMIGAVLIALFVRRRIVRSRNNEVELESLLNQAKAETLNRDGVTLLQSTTWEWTPNEQFTFKPIDKMSFSLDTSSLASLSKHEPIKVGVWNQSIISFSLHGGNNNNAKNKRSNLKERLINGTHVDIYAPKSPKYEIKIEPSSFDLDSDTLIHVTVSSMMRITAKCKVGLIVVCEHEQVYSICEFKLTSAMSTWIDLDEIEMTGDYLGGGGFGSVTRGIYRGQEVAVKKLLSQYLTPDLQIEFEREIMLMKDLHHPNIVQFIGASNIKNSLAIVIEFAPLGSLASVMEKHSLTLSMKVTMLLESAKALQFLHANGIIHRDIKPQNILVFSMEPKSPVHVKLTDFGTARMISEEATTVTKNIGTISFMSPESLGKNPRIEKSADVYSFALLMWSVLVEQTPFSEFKWDSDVEAHVKKGNRLAFPSDRSIDPLLISLITECWAHEPNTRPSMASVVQRLTTLSLSFK